MLDKVNIIDEVLPELNKLKQSIKEDISVEVYKGKEGMKTILNDMVREGKDYFCMGAIKEFEDLVPLYIKQIIRQVDKKGMKEKIILKEREEILEAKRHEYKYLPKEYLFLSGIIIYSDKVALFIWKEPFIQILIKNKDITESYLTQFNLLWKIAKK